MSDFSFRNVGRISGDCHLAVLRRVVGKNLIPGAEFLCYRVTKLVWWAGMRQATTVATTRAGSPRTRKKALPAAAGRGRMVHIRLEPELHRKIRLVVAAEDTTLQEWIARTLEAAAEKAWPSVAQGASQ